MRKMRETDDYEVLFGRWDGTMSHEQYLGLEEWLRDVRYYNCRSRKVFSKKDGEPYIGTPVPRMPSLAWKVLDYLRSKHDVRFRDLDKWIQNWYNNISRIANQLLRGHIRTQKQRQLLWRESDGLSVRWSCLCEAIWIDKYYKRHPSNAQITSQLVLAALYYGGHEHPRYLLGFEANEWGETMFDQHDRHDATEHIWPVWNGIHDSPAICERQGGVLFIKPVGGAVNWAVLGRKDRVQARHQDHHFSLCSPILRGLGLFPGPCAWHSTTEHVSELLRDAKGARMLLCGGAK